LGHLYIETSSGFISERYIVRMTGKHVGGEWTVFFFDGEKCCEATASPEAAREFFEKNDPIGR